MLSFIKWTTVVVFVMIIGISGSYAQATRTWVSGVGDDANPCSRTAPCKTFAGAISKTAAAGEINVLDPGGFGAVTITKAITIDGSGGNIAGVLTSGTNGIVVAAGADDVVFLRNLDMNGLNTSLSGIKFLTGGMLYVENSVIHGFQIGIDFEPSAASGLSVSQTVSRENSSGGLLVSPTGSGAALITVTGSRFEGGQYGVWATDESEVTINNSVAAGTTGNGFVAASTTNPVTIFLENCISTNNAFGGIVAGGAGATVRISNTTVTNNVAGILSIGGGNVVSFGNNHIAGNNVDGTPTSKISQQ